MKYLWFKIIIRDKLISAVIYQYFSEKYNSWFQTFWREHNWIDTVTMQWHEPQQYKRNHWYVENVTFPIRIYVPNGKIDCPPINYYTKLISKHSHLSHTSSNSNVLKRQIIKAWP